MTLYHLVLAIDVPDDESAQRCAHALLSQAAKVRPWSYIEAVAGVEYEPLQLRHATAPDEPLPDVRPCGRCAKRQGVLTGKQLTVHQPYVETGKDPDGADLVACTGCGRVVHA